MHASLSEITAHTDRLLSTALIADYPGAHNGLQLAFRPTLAAHPYVTPNPSLFLCSASTPPGAGVHGMCGWHAAERALAGPLRNRAV